MILDIIAWGVLATIAALVLLSLAVVVYRDFTERTFIVPSIIAALIALSLIACVLGWALKQVFG